MKRSAGRFAGLFGVLVLGLLACEPALNENECLSDDDCRFKPGTVCSPERWCVAAAPPRPDAAPRVDVAVMPDMATADSGTPDMAADAGADGAVIDGAIADGAATDGPLADGAPVDQDMGPDGAAPDPDMELADPDMADPDMADPDMALDPDGAPDMAPDPDMGAADAGLEERVAELFRTRCTPCHIGDERSGLRLDGDFAARIINAQALQSELDIVSPGSTSDSYLYRKIEGSHLPVGGGDRMPPGGPLVGPDERIIVADWINSL